MKTKEFAGLQVQYDEEGYTLTHAQAQELDRKLKEALAIKDRATHLQAKETHAKLTAARAEIRRLEKKLAKLEKEPAAIGGGAATKGDGFLGEEPKAVDHEAQRLYRSFKANKDKYDDNTNKWNPKP